MNGQPCDSPTDATPRAGTGGRETRRRSAEERKAGVRRNVDETASLYVIVLVTHTNTGNIF